jgi:hypothetical protein
MFDVALTSADLVGYLRAEFDKSSKFRVALFFVQLAVAVPAAVSVVIPDNYHEAVYALAIVGALFLALWWVINGVYVKSRSAAQAARRAALLTGGLAEPISPTEVNNLRERFTVSTDKAKKFEKGDYYASILPAGPGRLAEMLEESALYSEHLQRISSHIMLAVLWLFLIIFFGIALAATPFIEREMALLVLRVFLALIVFVMSADVLGAYQEHKSAAKEIRDIRQRLSAADANGYPFPDVLLAMTDYNAAVEGAPESVPWIYDVYAKELDQRWKDYQDDRAVARAKRHAS